MAAIDDREAASLSNALFSFFTLNTISASAAEEGTAVLCQLCPLSCFFRAGTLLLSAYASFTVSSVVPQGKGQSLIHCLKGWSGGNFLFHLSQ